MENKRKSVSKGLIGIIGVAALSMSLCFGAWGDQNVTLAWNATSASGNAGYVLYYGTASHNYTSRIDTGTNTQFTALGLKEGLAYYFAVTAYNAARVESAPSGEIVYLTPGILKLGAASGSISLFNMQFPVAPGHWYELQASVDLKTWINIWQTATANSNAWVAFQDPQHNAFPSRFYRLASHVSSALPPPVFQSETQTGPNVTLTWSALPGQTYQVQYAASPTSANWIDLGGVLAATNATETASYLVGTGSQWSYRAILAAPLPQPVFQSIIRTNGIIMFTWTTVAGQMYQVQYTSSLNHPNWKNLGGITTALGSTATASDVIGSVPQRFYRAVLLGALPPPVFESVTQANGTIVFTWNSVAGQMYQVQYTPSLTQPNWKNLGGIIAATGSTATASDLIGPDPQRFYRIVLLASSASPVIQSVTQAYGTIAFAWNSVAGQTYQVQYSSSLAQPNWLNLGGAVIAPGSLMTASDVIGPDPQRFYRVVWSR